MTGKWLFKLESNCKRTSDKTAAQIARAIVPLVTVVFVVELVGGPSVGLP